MAPNLYTIEPNLSSNLPQNLPHLFVTCNL